MAEQENKTKKGLREFGLTSLAVDNGTSVLVITIMILIFGVGAFNSMPKEQFPEISLPQVYINTIHFGNSAADIENLITRPIEKELQTIAGIKDIKSTSLQDYSVITAEFVSDMGIDEALLKVKDAVDKAKSELPTDLDQEPLVQDINLADLPIMTVNLSGNYSNDDLRDYGEYLEDKLEDIKEISSVDIKGALEREMKIDVDLYKMQSLRVNFQDIENAVASENITMSGGEIVNQDFRRAIRVVGEFKSAQELEDMIVKSENLKPIYLKDFADVSFGYKERTSYARSDALPVVSLDVKKRKGSNLLDASDKVKVIVAEAQVDYLPEGLKVSIFNDQSIQTRDEVANLLNSIISGVILVVLVLLFFLGIRNAMFVGMAIPLSMLMGIMILNAFGTTMNMIVLFSLILALGLLVDNAIVAVENIYRYMQEGYSGADAAKYGAGEVALPIIASTATTLAAFVPLAFWPGIMGSFMQYLPLTLIIVLLSSLFVALVINPVITSYLMKVDEKAESKKDRFKKTRNVLIAIALMTLFAFAGHVSEVYWMRNLLGIAAAVTLVNYFLFRPASFVFQNSFLPRLEQGYNYFIKGALYKIVPVLVFFGTFVLLFASSKLLGDNMPKVEYFPKADPLYINAFVELPMGSDIEATNEIMKDIEAKIDEVLTPNAKIVEAVLSQIGEDTADPNGPPEPGASPHKARLTVSFVPSKDRDGISTFEIMEEIRGSLNGYAGVQIVVDKNADGPATGKAINLELKGENIDELAVLSDKVIAYLNEKNVAGVEELQADVKIGKPEVVININREAARSFGISTYSIASEIRTAVFGKEVSKFKQGEDEYPIYVRLEDKYRFNIDDLLNQKITFRDPASGQIKQVPISTVATIEYTSTYSSIKRRDLDRMITIYSNVLEGYNANEVVAELDDLMGDYDLPADFAYEFTGEQQQQSEDMAFLATAFMLALFSIFLILVAQFNSVISPFIIVFSVIFSTIGVFLGYVFTGRDMVIIMTGMGIISLAGIVVNNAIVLIDYVNLLIERKREELGLESIGDIPRAVIRDCIIQGGATRLRPVLLTAITTVLGLVPLAIGLNINFFTIITELDPQIFIGGDNVAFWGPMAWTVIYGLVFATFLTLVVVPVMYWLAYVAKYFFVNAFKAKKVQELDQSDVELAE
ncbi:MAG: efflux RND transporter permease subunit [Saprospiraceae bacterium]